MSKKNGHNPPPRRAPGRRESSFGRWFDLQPFWLLDARLRRVLTGAGWLLAPSADDEVAEFTKGRWRVFATGPPSEKPFSLIILMHFATVEQCRDYRSDPPGRGPVDVYEAYSLEMAWSLLRCADSEVADEIDSYLWGSS